MVIGFSSIYAQYHGFGFKSHDEQQRLTSLSQDSFLTVNRYLHTPPNYSENEIMMTQRRLRELSNVSINYRPMTKQSLVVAVLSSRNVMPNNICSRCSRFLTNSFVVQSSISNEL